MKKVFFIACLLSISSGMFAINKKRLPVKKLILSCCTATLTYNGVPVDFETYCSGALTTLGACDVAKNILLDRNPKAKNALIGI